MSASARNPMVLRLTPAVLGTGQIEPALVWAGANRLSAERKLVLADTFDRWATQLRTMSNTEKKKPREHMTFRACGPIRLMVENELKQGRQKTRVLEDSVAYALGPKYPKLLQRFKILREEALS